MNIPLVLTLSVIPDIDLLIPFLEHRGLTHSIIIASLVFIPIFILYRKRAAPYFVALIQHSLVGDFLVGGKTQLLFPLSTQYFGTGMSILSQTSVAIEWAAFLTSILVMVMIKDIKTFFQPHNSNLILTVPTLTVLLPTFLAYPLQVPTILVAPHIVYLILFVTSILIDLRTVLR